MAARLVLPDGLEPHEIVALEEVARRMTDRGPTRRALGGGQSSLYESLIREGAITRAMARKRLLGDIVRNIDALLRIEPPARPARMR